MVNYLKKTKMHELAKTLVFGIAGLKSCTYKFYRGTEWLYFCDENYNCYELCRMGSYVSLESYYTDDETCARIVTNRICYVLVDGVLKETYRRVS